MKLLIAAGGTGGHIFPGIAVAKELIRRDAATEVLFVGTARGLETKIVPDNGFQLALINSAGLKSVGVARQDQRNGRASAKFLGSEKFDQGIQARCCHRRRRICFRPGSDDREFDACADDRYGFERPSGFY